MIAIKNIVIQVSAIENSGQGERIVSNYTENELDKVIIIPIGDLSDAQVTLHNQYKAMIETLIAN